MAGLRSAMDVIGLGVTVASAERSRERAGRVFEKNAVRLALRVERGSIDPLQAESDLSDMGTEADRVRIGRFEVQDHTGEALERLVLDGAIDPIAAENMLDNFGIATFTTASTPKTTSSR